MDFVLDNGLKATQLGARAVNYRVAQQVIHADRPAIFLYNATTLQRSARISVGCSGPERPAFVHGAWLR